MRWGGVWLVWVRVRRGSTLIELLVATGLVLAILAVVAAALPPVLDAVRAVPEAVDLHERSRAAATVVTMAIAAAGAGADLLGDAPLVRHVPAILPRRVGADRPGTAWADRFTTLHAAEGAAQAPLAQPLAAGTVVVQLAPHPACGVAPSCGFRRGDVALVASIDGTMAVSRVAAVNGLQLTLDPAIDQNIALPAYAVAVTLTALYADAGRRQLRRVADLSPSQPVTDDVVGMTVRYYGTAAPPRFPVRPGADTCAVAADGTPRLGMLGSVPGPPVELTVGQFLDGPWCGSGLWQFDADLLRVRAVRVSLRLQASSPAVRGRDLVVFANPGATTRRGQEVRDVVLDVFADAPNLAWAQ